MKEKEISSLPNMLTGIRMACIPVVFLCLSFSGKLWSLIAAVFISLAFVTDILDGFFARKYGSVTVIGKFLDPLADKILVSVALIMLIPMGRIPAWMVAVIVIRELIITGLRGIAGEKDVIIEAGKLGKYKTIFQSVALIGLCIHYEYMGINFHKLGMGLMWIALIFTVWSGLDYLCKFRSVLVEKTDV
jgi:CDP-diacylglycerol--glycerol-3-phosphate 3-phosphatidyltransferase